MKFIELVKKWAWHIIAITFLLLWIDKGCTSKKISKTNKALAENNDILVNKVDSLTTSINILEETIVNESETRDIMDEVMWKFLELEELSDKNHIPINELKYKDKK